MVKLTNPQGKEIVLEEKDFKELLFKFEKSNSFQEWARENNLVGSFIHNRKKVLNRMVLQEFLKQKGYILIKNMELKKDN